MRGSFSKYIILFLIIIVIATSVMGIVAVKAQDGSNPGDEPYRPTQEPPSGPVTKTGEQAGGLEPERASLLTKWYTMAGSVFIPSQSGMTWAYGGSGCMQPNSGGVWRASINLPDGSKVRYFWFGYYSYANSTSSAAYFYRYGYDGSTTTIATLNSNPGSSATGYHYVNVNLPDITIDNSWNAYVFVWGGSTNQQLCYMQIGYVPQSIFGVALPVIKR